MAASRDVFIDSNYLIALFSPDDQLHSAALRYAQKLQEENQQAVISSFIFLETVTVLSQRRGRAIACTAGQKIETNPNIRIIHIDTALQKYTWTIFQAVEHKNISFVDCSTIAIMQTEGIATLLTFDETDFKKLQKQYRLKLYR